MPTKLPEKLISVNAAAEIICMSPSSVYRFYHEGKIRGVKIKGTSTIKIIESSAKEMVKIDHD